VTETQIFNTSSARLC